jgi:hypothetical protein
MLSSVFPRLWGSGVPVLALFFFSSPAGRLIRFQLFVACGMPTEGCATVSVAMSGAWWGLSDAGSGSSDKICCRG